MPLSIEKLSPRLRTPVELFAVFVAVDSPGLQAKLNCSKNAVKKVMKRLCYSGWTEARRLPTGGLYWMLTRRGRKALGLSLARRDGLNHDQIILAVGTLHACTANAIRKVSAAGLEPHRPDLLCTGVPTHAYGVDAGCRIVWLVIDRGAAAERLPEKARKAVHQRYRHAAWREVIDAGEFSVVLVVPTAEKAALVTAAIPSFEFKPTVSVRVIVVPALAPLLLLKGQSK